MRFVTYNIRYGVGLDGRLDLDRIADTVADADVVALQEVDRFWPRSGMRDQPRELGKRLPLHWWVYGPTIDLHSAATVPGEEGDRRRQFGNMVLSRSPIRSSRTIPLPRSEPSTGTMQRGALEATIDARSGPVRVYSTHLCYLDPDAQRRQLHAISVEQRAAAAHTGAWSGRYPYGDDGWILGDEPSAAEDAVVLGDMNFTPSSVVHHAAAAFGLLDAWRAAGHVHDPRTHESGRIDYAFVTAGLADRVVGAWIDHDAVGSDHRPLWFDIDV